MKKEKHWTDREIVWDLERMKHAVEAPVHIPPKGLSQEEIRDWLLSLNTTAKKVKSD